MFIEQFRFQNGKDENLILYRGLRNILLLFGFSSPTMLEKRFQYSFIVYFFTLMSGFAFNAYYSMKLYLAGEKVDPTFLNLCTIQYILYVLIRFVLHKTIATNFIAINKNDRIGNYVRSPKDNIITAIIVSTSFSLRIFNYVFSLVYNENGKFYIHLAFSYLLFFVCDIGQVTNVLPTEYLWSRAKFAKETLQKHLLADISESKKIEKIKETMRFIYGSTEAVKSIENISKLQTLVSLVVVFIYIIVELRSFVNQPVRIVFTVHLVYVLMLPCLSSLVHELWSSEVDKTKLIIIKEYVNCKEEKNRRALSDALLVWRIRSFRRTMWRVFPLDITLPLNFIALVTTNSIVVAQFQKLI